MPTKQVWLYFMLVMLIVLVCGDNSDDMAVFKSNDLPKPFLNSFSRVIVPSIYKEWNRGVPLWASEEMQRKYNYSVFVYQKLNSSGPNYLSSNRGSEGGVFLKYIVDHYDNFPDIAIFVHAIPEKHSPSWFQKINCIRPTASYFNINEVRFVRTPFDWGRSCSIWMEQCWRDVLKIVNFQVPTVRINSIAHPGPIEVRATCCQQFLISRDMIRSRPLAVWKQLYEIIGESNVCHKGRLDHAQLQSVGAYNAFKAPPEAVMKFDNNDHGQLIQGMTMEHLAHVVFGQQSLVTSEPSMADICKQFVDSTMCPGSPCTSEG